MNPAGIHGSPASTRPPPYRLYGEHRDGIVLPMEDVGTPWWHSWFHVERIWADLRALQPSCHAAADLR